MHIRRTIVGLVAIGLALVACTGGGDGGVGASSSGSSSGGSSGASSGSTSSSSSSGASSTSSSSGSVQTSTSCTPELAAGYFDGATPNTDASLTKPPCPAGYKAKLSSGSGFSGSFTPPVRYASEAELVADYCDVDPSDAGSGGMVTVDYATQDVVVVLVPGLGFTSAPMLVKGDELWVRRTNNQACSGAGIGAENNFYIVPKGKELKVQDCTTSCTCTPGPCQFACRDVTKPSSSRG